MLRRVRSPRLCILSWRECVSFVSFLGFAGFAAASGACSGALNGLGPDPEDDAGHAYDAPANDSAAPGLGDSPASSSDASGTDAGPWLAIDSAAPVADDAAPPPGPLEAGPSPDDDAGPSPVGDGGGPAGATQVVEMTFYGWDDNTPPGKGIAYPHSRGFPTVHDDAGGVGTYADPITFASDEAELPPGTRVYAPVIEKYLVMEDDCPKCDSEWSGSMHRHVNVWMNSDGTEKVKSLDACESSWAQAAATIEINPPQGRTVTTNPLFVPATDTCRTTP
jgi:hypothetical protein